MRFILFDIPTPWGDIPVMGYGLMIVLGFIFGISMAWWRAKRCGENPEHIVNLGLFALLGGITGARLLYILQHADEFTGMGLRGNLMAMANVRAGGLVYYGGLLLAIVICMTYILLKRLSARRILDIVAASLMLGLAFGRAGCTLNGCCWGGACELESEGMKQVLTITFPFASPAFGQQAQRLPWRVLDEDGHATYYEAVKLKTAGGRVAVDDEGRPIWVHVEAASPSPKGPVLTMPEEFVYAADAKTPDGQKVYYYLDRETIRDDGKWGLATRKEYRSLPVYAVQPMGIINGLLLCLVLNVYFGYRKREGQVFAVMLMLYPISRFLLEGVRQDTDPVALGMTMSQNISIYMFLGGVAMWLVLRKLRPVAQVPLSGVPDDDK